MLNERRVKHMIRMAMYDKHENHSYRRMLNTGKKEYVSLQDLLGIVIGTLFYLIIVGVAAVVIYMLFSPSINRVIVGLCIIVVVLCYIVFLYHYRSFVHQRALWRYAAAKKRINRMQKDWDTLEEMYKEEDGVLASEHMDQN